VGSAYNPSYYGVVLLYNVYKNQEAGKIAPKAYLYLEPLVAMEQILQHVLPKHFQKSRRHGLHNANTNIKKSIPDKLKNNVVTIRTLMEIIAHLTKLKPFQCDKCKSVNFTTEEIQPNKTWIHKFITPNTLRAPPIIIVIENPLDNTIKSNIYSSVALD
jgi:phage FluMu protein Com